MPRRDGYEEYARVCVECNKVTEEAYSRQT